MNNTNKIYTAIDFAKYHAGTMPAKEMHALEKAALEDDFLADALDGYTFTQTEEEDLAAIKSTLATQNDTAKVVPIASKNNWMQYAAAAAIVLGMVTVFYNVNNKGSENTLAKNEVATNVSVDSFSNTQAENSVLKTDSVVVSGNKKNDKFLNVAPGGIAGFTTPNTTTNTYYDNDNATAAPSTYATITPNKNFDFNTTRDNSNLNSNQLNSNIFQNNVENKKGGPKQFNNYRNNTATNNAVVQNNGTVEFINYPAAKPTADGYAEFKSNTDSTYKTDLAKNDDRAKNKEVEKKAGRADTENKKLEEVVVTGYGVKSKQMTRSTTTTDALAGKVAGVQVTQGETSNTNLKIKEREKFETNTSLSITQFNIYVKKNIKPVFDEKGNEIKGKVMLSFKTNKKGQPTKIKVTQSLSKKANEQAIELLKNATTTWETYKSDRIIVEINF